MTTHKTQRADGLKKKKRKKKAFDCDRNKQQKAEWLCIDTKNINYPLTFKFLKHYLINRDADMETP